MPSVSENVRSAWLITPSLLMVGILFLGPVCLLLSLSFSEPVWGIQNYKALFASRIYINVLINTITISAIVTLACLFIGYPMAFTIANVSLRARRFLLFVVVVPFWTSVLVRTFAWVVILQQNGVVNSILVKIGLVTRPLALVHNRTGVLIGMVHVLLPFMILPIYSVMTRVDERLVKAAATLGASPVRRFFRVYFPLTVPGVMSGAVLVFIMGLGFYITPALLGGPQDAMISQVIQTEVTDLGRWGRAGALSALLLVFVAVALGTLFSFSREA